MRIKLLLFDVSAADSEWYLSQEVEMPYVPQIGSSIYLPIGSFCEVRVVVFRLEDDTTEVELTAAIPDIKAAYLEVETLWELGGDLEKARAMLGLEQT